MIFLKKVIGVALICAAAVMGCAKQDQQMKKKAEKIHVVVAQGDVEALRQALTENPNLLHAEIEGFTPLHVACAGIVAWRSWVPKEQRVDAKIPLARPREIAELLIEAGSDIEAVNQMGNTPLHIAASAGLGDVVKLLLSKNAQVNARGWEQDTPLHDASEKGHATVVKLLVDHGADVNAKNTGDETPLYLACQWKHFDVAEVLLFSGANPRQLTKFGGFCALGSAVAHNNFKVTELLLQHGADVNNADKIFSITPLHVAAREGHRQIVELLLKHSADASLKDNKGNTALQLAEQNGHNDIVELLRSNQK